MSRGAGFNSAPGSLCGLRTSIATLINLHENCSRRQIPVQSQVPPHITLASLLLKRLFPKCLNRTLHDSHWLSPQRKAEQKHPEVSSHYSSKLTQKSNQDNEIDMRAYINPCKDISCPVTTHLTKLTHEYNSNEAGFPVPP